MLLYSNFFGDYMKFTCDKCNKKYGIDNKKLESYGPSFKIKCQNCNHIIVVTNPYSKKAPLQSSKEWYLFLNNEQLGPMSIDEIKEYINKGELVFSTLVWKAGMDDWKQAQAVDDLKHLIKLPIRTSERRKNQSEKLNMLYDEFEQTKTNQTKEVKTIDESAFDEDEKTLTRDEFNKKLNGEEKEEEEKVFSVEEEEDSTSVTSDDFFENNYQEKKEDKDSKLLRSLTGNSSMGNTGIFVMYNQKRKKERLAFMIALAIVLVVGISVIVYFKNKEPKTIVQEKIKIVKEKGETKIVEKIKYIEVKGDDGKVRKVRVNNTKKDDKILKDDTNNKKDINKKEVDLYGGRNLGTTDNSKKLAIKSKNSAIGPTGDYGKDVAKIVSDSKRGVFWCYRKELKANPDLVAKVYFKLNISASGRVNSVSSNFKPSKYNGSSMGSCMENKIKLWKFPNNPDGEAIDFKFSIALKAN